MVQRVTSYPVFADSIRAYKSNPYGAKSLSLAHQASDTFLQPILPYAEKPYAYFSPYFVKADEVATVGLGKVETRFPIVKEDTKTIHAKLHSIVAAPYDGAMWGKDYVVSTWGREYKHCDGSDKGGLIVAGKAAIVTGMVLTSDLLGWVGDTLRVKKQQGMETMKEKTGAQ